MNVMLKKKAAVPTSEKRLTCGQFCCPYSPNRAPYSGQSGLWYHMKRKHGETGGSTKLGGHKRRNNKKNKNSNSSSSSSNMNDDDEIVATGMKKTSSEMVVIPLVLPPGGHHAIGNKRRKMASQEEWDGDCGQEEEFSNAAAPLDDFTPISLDALKQAEAQSSIYNTFQLSGFRIPGYDDDEESWLEELANASFY